MCLTLVYGLLIVRLPEPHILETVPNKDFTNRTDKVRTVVRSLYKRIVLVISLNVVYLLMFNNDSTKHVWA